jgi:hypothetical protein
MNFRKYIFQFSPNQIYIIKNKTHPHLHLISEPAIQTDLYNNGAHVEQERITFATPGFHLVITREIVRISIVTNFWGQLTTVI